MTAGEPPGEGEEASAAIPAVGMAMLSDLDERAARDGARDGSAAAIPLSFTELSPSAVSAPSGDDLRAMGEPAGDSSELDACALSSFFANGSATLRLTCGWSAHGGEEQEGGGAMLCVKASNFAARVRGTVEQRRESTHLSAEQTRERIAS